VNAPTFATCNDCGQEMAPGTGCVQTQYRIGEDTFDRIPHHDGGLNCHDCNTPPGALHHPGCDNERCPACHGQSISCGCGEPDPDAGVFEDAL
jgi:hypothetical protein